MNGSGTVNGRGRADLCCACVIGAAYFCVASVASGGCLALILVSGVGGLDVSDDALMEQIMNELDLDA